MFGVQTRRKHSGCELEPRAKGALGVHTQGAHSAHVWGALSGCKLGLHWGAVLGCMFGVHSWGVLSVREFRVLWGCSLGVHALAVSSGCAWRGRGVSGAPLLRGPYPHTAVSPRKVVCFRKWLLHVAVVTGANAPAPGRAKASREGRLRGAGDELGGPPHWEGLWCDIPPPRPGLFHDRNMCDCPLWQGLLQGLQVQGDELGIVLRYFFFPLNSIFSTLWSSGGSRRRLLLRETSGIAIVANALNSCALANPVPTGSLAF